MGFGIFVEDAVMSTMSTYVTTKAAAVTAALVPVATGAVTGYILWTGYQVMRGEGKEPFLTVMWRWFRVAAIAGIALNAPQYQSLVVEGLTGIQGAFATAFGSASSVGGTVDSMADPIFTLATTLFSEGTTGLVPQFGLIIAGLLAGVAICIIGLTSMGMFLVASVSLSLLLAMGPAFIFCAMFPSTQKYTESWLGQVLSAIFTNILLMACIGLFTDIIRTSAQGILASYGIGSAVVDVLGLLVLTTTLTYVLMHVQSIATALSGGLSIGSAGQELGSAVTRALTGGLGAGIRAMGQRVGAGAMARSLPNTIRQQGPSVAERGIDLYQRYVMDWLRRAA